MYWVMYNIPLYTDDNTDSIDSSGLDTPVYCIPPDPTIDPSTHSCISSPDLLAFYPEGLEKNSQVLLY